MQGHSKGNWHVSVQGVNLNLFKFYWCHIAIPSECVLLPSLQKLLNFLSKLRKVVYSCSRFFFLIFHEYTAIQSGVLRVIWP